VSDQDLVLAAVEEAYRALYIDPGSRRNAEAAINVLFFLLDPRATLLLLNAQVSDSHSSRITSKAADSAG
jgi:hypothetical protein